MKKVKYKFEDFEIKKLLGKGKQGSVYLCNYKKDNKSYALKAILCYDINDANDSLKEVWGIRNILHENIIEYIDVFLHEHNGSIYFCILMNYFNKSFNKFKKMAERFINEFSWYINHSSS